MGVYQYINGIKQKISGNVVCDAALNANSTNAVQNKVVTNAITQLNNDLESGLADCFKLPSSVTLTSHKYMAQGIVGDTTKMDGICCEIATIIALGGTVSNAQITSKSVHGLGTPTSATIDNTTGYFTLSFAGGITSHDCYMATLSITFNVS